MRMSGRVRSGWPSPIGSIGAAPVVAFLGAALVVRVLSDNRSSADSRQTGSVNLSGAIALVLIVVALALIARRRRGLLPSCLAVLFIVIWTAVAASTRGASTETLREGVREGSIFAVAIVVCNAARAVSMSTAARIVQIAGFIPAVIALYQLAAGTGLDVDHNIRPNGTFSHPNGAAMFFATAVVVSLWRYTDHGRRRPDLLLLVLFTASLIATFSIDGLIALSVMLAMFGALSAGAGRIRLLPFAIAVVACLVFFATPLGSRRIANESSTRLAAVEGAEPNTSLAWRLKKWNLLLHVWKEHPIVGLGLGTTITEGAIPGNKFAGEPPHNEYVRYLAETGVIGLVVVAAAVATLFRALVRRRSEVAKSAASSMTLALVVVVGFLVDALADNTLLYTPGSYAAALIVASALMIPAITARARSVT
jgi:O-antigen ligase